MDRKRQVPCYALLAPMVRKSLTHAAALLGFVAVGVVFSWPLPVNLSTQLTGPPSGDTGIYVWNTWVFRQEMLGDRWPFATGKILGLADGADLALENYTVVQDLLALPLIPIVGAIASFNMILLGMVVLTAYGTFLLARREVGHSGAAWLAGVLFAWSPVMVARSTAHASLVAAAALPFFVLALDRLRRRQDALAGLMVGATIAWATYSDVYYGVYCLLLGLTLLLWPHLRCERRPPGTIRAGRLLDASIALAAVVAITIGVTGGASLRLGNLVVHARTLYTPALLLTLLVAVRASTLVRVRLEGWREMLAPPFLRAGLIGAITAAALLSPLVVSFATQYAATDATGAARVWRSSPNGIDLLALVLPNPNNPWFGYPGREWLRGLPGAFVENVASLPWAALVAVAMALLLSRSRAVRGRWVGVGAVFTALALGPFIHVAGVNTCVPGPWALLRFVPVIGLARTPTRFTIVVTLAFSLLFAAAVAALAARGRVWRQLVLPVVLLLTAVELNPAPRELHAARTSSVYEFIAADHRDVRVLELPFGLRDGTQSHGNFRPSTQFNQISHGKGLLGGYLSRIPRRTVREYKRRPTTAALMTLSAGGTLPPEELAHLVRRGYAFVHRTRTAYVVIRPRLVSPELERFAIEAFGLQRIAEDGERVLYRTSFDESALVVYGESAQLVHHPVH